MGISAATTQYIVEMSQLFKVSSDYILGINNNLTLNLDEFSDEELKLIYLLAEYIKNNKIYPDNTKPACWTKVILKNLLW